MRLAIYVFFEKRGIVHDHVRYYLQALQEEADSILLIANGLLDQQGRDWLSSVGIRFLIRKNTGFDFSAWKAGLEYLGWDNVCKHDELILCNCSCYGPIYPFSEMFDAMKKCQCDFWGINRQPDAPAHLIGPREAPFPMTEHIQSYFYVFRQTALASAAFRRWWEELIPSRNYWDEVHEHEMRFSPWLESQGLVGDAFMDFEKYRNLSPDGDANFVCPDVQLIEDRNPLVKRRLIFANREESIRVLEFIHGHTKYPLDIILRDMEKQMPTNFFARLKASILSILLRGSQKKRYVVKSQKYRMLDLLKHSHRAVKG